MTISTTSGSIQRWIMAQPYKAALAERCEEMAGISDSDPAVRTSDDIRNEEDVQALINTVSSMVNPFAEEEELISISSGAVATTEASVDLTSAHTKGAEQYQLFIKERLIDRTKNLFDPIPKISLRDFTVKSATNKTKAKATSAAQDRALFSRLLIASQNRSIDLREILSFSLAVQPPALSNTEGGLTKVPKSLLLHELEAITEKPHVDMKEARKVAVMIDSMALIQVIPTKNLKTFADLAESVWLRILAIGSKHGAGRVDFVADVYRPSSIKDVERARRTKAGVQRIRITQANQKMPKQWGKFLGHPDNKNELLQFLLREFSDSRQLEGLEVYVSAGPNCHRLSTRLPATPCQEVADLRCSHEEADTRLLLHSKHADNAGYDQILIVSPDTDVVIISLGVIGQLKAKLGFVTGKAPNTRLIDLSMMATRLGNSLCQSLPYMHALTGCDSVSSFFGRSKKKALGILRTDVNLQEEFSHSDFKPSPSKVASTDEFVCKLYGAKSVTVNEARYDLFKSGAGEGKLPPNDDCLLQHINRATYQAGIWHRALEQNPDIP